jgi:TatD DNase family protein
MLIDTHCHLNFKAFEDDVDKVIFEAKAVGIEKIIVPGAAMETSLKAVELAEKFREIYATVGVHPVHIQEAGEVEKFLGRFLGKEKVVGIGETGLDYKDKNLLDKTKKKQQNLFLTHLLMAEKRGLPVIIHNREASEDVLKVISIFEGKVHGVFHCFSGDEDFLKKVIKMGFFVGVDGNVTYNKALQGIVKKIPLEKMVLETDSPFLTPIPYRGLRNEPKNVKLVGEFIAKIRDISFEKMVEETGKNAARLFGI